MASTYSTNLRIEKMADGENSTTWGSKTNTNWDLIEQAVSGVSSVAMTDADYTLTTSNAAVDEARNAVVIMTGTLTQARNVIVPSVDKQYVFKNSTTGGFSIVVKTSGGTGVTIPNGETVQVYCDATNVLLAETGGATTAILVGGGVGSVPVWTAATGSGAPVRATSPTLVTPNLGTPSTLVGTNITGTAAGLTAGAASTVAVGGITGLGTGVGTALAANVGSAGAPVVFNGALGTPSSGSLSNCGGLLSTGVAYTPAGTGAAATTVQTKLREIVSVKDFGATGDGTTDDLANIQEAIDYVSTLGGGEVHFPQGDYKITDTIDVIAGNVMLMGRGGDETHDVGTIGAQAATVIKWGGAAGGTMIKFSSPTGASAQKQHGGGVVGFYLDSNYNTNGAGIGILLETWNSAEIKNVFCREFATACLKITSLPLGSIGEAQDSQQNRIIGLTGRQLLAGGRFIMLDGDSETSGNASMNYFENCDVVVQGMAAGQGAYDLLDCDNNVFMRCRAYAAAADDVIMFHAAADGGTARENVFINFSTNSNGAIQCKGTEEATNPSTNNKFIAPDTSNGAGAPTMGTGATVHYDKNGTFTPTIAFGGLSAGVTYITQLGTYTRLGNRVFFDIYIVLSSKGSSTGAIGIFGLPFISANNGIPTAVSLRVGALEAAVATDVAGYIQPNTAGVSLNRFAAGVVTDMTDTDVNNVSNFVISGSYQAA